VLGISPDPVAKVKKFHDKEGLNFALLADEGHHVVDAYGVWASKSLYKVSDTESVDPWQHFGNIRAVRSIRCVRETPLFGHI
jgi:alkyl hydroperoxide reductase subunit AhpC